MGVLETTTVLEATAGVELESLLGVVEIGTGVEVCGGTAGVVVTYGVGVWTGKVEV